MKNFNLNQWRECQIRALKGKGLSPAFNTNFDVMYGANCRPVDLSSKEKVVIFGLPRSGNTWLQTLLSIILSYPVIDPWFEVESGGVGMCHRPLNDEVFLRTDFVHAICIVRDIRDIAASYYSYVQSVDWRSKRPWFTTTSHQSFFYDYFFPRMESLYDIENFWDKYVAFNLPIVRYENLVEDPQLTLQNLCAQLGLSIEVEAVKVAINKTNFAILKREGISGHGHIPPSHFGKGVTGSYKELLPQSIINEIEIRYGDTLRRWGYAQG